MYTRKNLDKYTQFVTFDKRDQTARILEVYRDETIVLISNWSRMYIVTYYKVT